MSCFVLFSSFVFDSIVISFFVVSFTRILRVGLTDLQKQYYKWILTKNYKQLNKGTKTNQACSFLTSRDDVTLTFVFYSFFTFCPSSLRSHFKMS